MKQVTLYSIFAIFVIACYQSPALAAGSTAKVPLAQAQETAIKWMADATLVQLITYSGNANGTADKWVYVFHSPEAKRGYQVTVSDGKIVQAFDVSASFTDSVDLDFIDSSQVIAEANKKGLKVKNGKSMMMLHTMDKDTKTLYWTIVGDMEEGTSMIFYALTGKFFMQDKFM
jgi:hypothetical protein